MDTCKYLNRCEQFQADPTLRNYCKVSGDHFSKLAYITPSIINGYLASKKKAEEMVNQALVQVKLSRSELDKYEYGVSQIKEFYKQAIPEAVYILKTFKDLEDRLVVENKPIENVLKIEILRQTLIPTVKLLPNPKEDDANDDGKEELSC
jgi:hypothetical protein